jgi:FkbM family methyltransferase
MVYSHYDNRGIPLENKLDDLFDKKTNGFFIELGANDGLFQSNTAFLEKTRNWRGILIEPSIKGWEACKNNRPDSVCLNYACVSNDYTEEFVEGDFGNNHPMGSVNGARMNCNDLCKVKASTLESILDTNNCGDIDFLSLDTEGYELNILQGLNLDKYHPMYILIEIYNSDYDNIVNFLRDKKYTLHSNFTNYNPSTNPGWDGLHNDYLFMYNTHPFL